MQSKWPTCGSSGSSLTPMLTGSMAPDAASDRMAVPKIARATERDSEGGQNQPEIPREQESYFPELLDPRCRFQQGPREHRQASLYPRRLELQSALVMPQIQLVEKCRGGCHGPPRVTLGRKVSGAETPTKRRGAERSKDEARRAQRGALG